MVTVEENTEDKIKKSNKQQERNSIIIICSGISIILAILISQYIFFLSYSSNTHQQENYIDDNIHEEKIISTEKAALPTIIILLIGLGVVLTGIRSIFISWINSFFINSDTTNKHQKEKNILKLKKYVSKNIFWISSVCYFFINSFLSNTIIFRPFESLSYTYHVSIPSWYIIGCCGLPGYYPVLTVYLTNHLGILFIPINVILLSILSILVGFNISLMLYRNYKKKINGQSICKINGKKNSTMVSMGAILGLFVECPVCAGSMLVYFFGGNIAAVGAETTFTSQFQPLFVSASIILLLVSPILFRFNKI